MNRTIEGLNGLSKLKKLEAKISQFSLFKIKERLQWIEVSRVQKEILKWITRLNCEDMNCKIKVWNFFLQWCNTKLEEK